MFVKFAVKLNLQVIQRPFSTASVQEFYQIQLNANPHNTACRFDNQNKSWSFTELCRHSDAFAYGLVELGFKPSDTLGLWLDGTFSSETVTAILGASKAGVLVKAFNVKNENDLTTKIKKSKGLLFSPSTKLGVETQLEVLQKLIPEMNQTLTGDQIQSKNFTNLKHIIHTGFYGIPSTIKYRNVLVYATNNYNSLALPKVDLSTPLLEFNDKTYSLKDLVGLLDNVVTKESKNKQLVIQTQNKDQTLAYALGALFTMKSGSNLVFSDKNQQDLQKFFPQGLMFDGSSLKSY